LAASVPVLQEPLAFSDNPSSIDPVTIPVSDKRVFTSTSAAVLEGDVGVATGQGVPQMPGVPANDSWTVVALPGPISHHRVVEAKPTTVREGPVGVACSIRVTQEPVASFADNADRVQAIPVPIANDGNILRTSETEADCAAAIVNAGQDEYTVDEDTGSRDSIAVEVASEMVDLLADRKRRDRY
jgi:hypothetical protein